MKLIFFLSAILSFFLFSCKPEEKDSGQEVSPCTYNDSIFCVKKNYEIVVDTFDEIEGMVRVFKDKFAPNPDRPIYFIESKDSLGEYSGWDFYPCNLPDNFKIDRKLIIFSGIERNCPHVIFPNEGSPFGRLLELTYIKSKDY